MDVGQERERASQRLTQTLGEDLGAGGGDLGTGGGEDLGRGGGVRTWGGGGGEDLGAGGGRTWGRGQQRGSEERHWKRKQAGEDDRMSLRRAKSRVAFRGSNGDGSRGLERGG